MHKCYSNHAYMHGYCSSCIYYFTFFLSLLYLTFSFSTSHSHLSLFLSLVPQSSLIDMISLALPINLTDMLISLTDTINPTSFSPISPTSLIWSHSSLILFNFLFDQFWIFCLISGFQGDGGLMMVAGWVDGGCGLIVDGG